jgi:hypothetical protein
VLVVTTSQPAEARLAWQAYLAAEARGGEPLRILLTTTTLIARHPEGILGPVWRRPGPTGPAPERTYWLPGGPARGLFGVGRTRPPTAIEPGRDSP